MAYNRHSEEANSLIFYLINQYWSTKNLSFPKARFFATSGKTDFQCRPDIAILFYDKRFLVNYRRMLS
jgi:hypothetical protein